MIEQRTIEHHIQKHILGVLMYQKYARFRDLRPPKIDTNLYSYHLKLLQKNDFINKTSDGYTLTQKGIIYIDRVSTATLDVRLQPKITTMFVIQNSDGDVLLFQRYRQPFVGQWALPNGKVHITDTSMYESAHRELKEKLNLHDQPISKAGDCYIRTFFDGEVVMSTYVHVFYLETNDVTLNERLMWARPHKLSHLELAPAVEQIITRTFFRDPYFFEEFTEELLQ